jgi:hypothetical protein
MKKIFTFFKATTLLLSLLFTLNVSAQDRLACGLNLNVFSRPFEFLSDGTRVTDIESSCGNKTGIPLGFTFKYGACGFKSSYTTVQVSSAGWIKFGAAVPGCRNDPAAGYPIFPGLWPFYGKTMNGTGGTATYYTELLSTGLKVFTMEWKDWSWDSLTAGSQKMSVQVKLYEGSDIIEYCYKNGTSTVTAGSTPYMIGLGVTAPTGIVTWPCTPGYDYSIINASTVPSAPVLNKSGAYGPAVTSRPKDEDVYQFYQECCGKPTAGVVSQPDSVCPGSPFVLKASGATPNPFSTFGVSYQWQAAPSATGPWADITGAISPTQLIGTGIYNDSFFRMIVYCSKSNMYDTTAAKRVTLITQSYNCYCYSAATNDVLTVNIGSFKLIAAGNDTLINTGTGTPAFLNKGVYRPYTLFTGMRPIKEVNRDTTYKFSVMGVTRDTFSFATSGVALYIDYNADGVYSPSTELAGFQVVSGTKADFITSFTVPTTAALDTVGMRVIMRKGAATAADVLPCNGYPDGETEDYLLIISNPRCPGPLSAGKAYISDTSICDGYTVTIWDTAHAKNMSRMHWEWEYSLDNVIWANVPASKFKDTIQPVVRQSTYYRLRIVCENTLDTIYSNKVFIKLKQPYKCYCYSLANGGSALDSSDISTVVLGSFIANVGGPHLKNPKSIRQRTDYTDLPAIELYAQDKYNIAVYHTLKGNNHADAKISVYMDFNHNLKYDGASEMVWSKVSTATDFYPHDTITIPVAVIPNVETGMRVVLNNDLGPGNPNDIGCDEFISGEIEDFLVIFRRRGTSIGEITNVDNLQIYPNPTSGQFTISFSATKTINDAKVIVTNITGQQVYAEQYTNISTAFNKNINLGAQPAGVYFITLVADGQKQVNKLIVR